jgi:hypothetical protein
MKERLLVAEAVVEVYLILVSMSKCRLSFQEVVFFVEGVPAAVEMEDWELKGVQFGYSLRLSLTGL